MSKLIRDNYDEIIDEDQLAQVESKDEYVLALAEKLEEECAELAVSGFSDVDEFADVIEVLYAFAKLNSISIEDITHARHLKLEDKGGFTKGLLLLDK